MRCIKIKECKIDVCPYYSVFEDCGHPKTYAKKINPKKFLRGFPIWCELEELKTIKDSDNSKRAKA